MQNALAEWEGNATQKEKEKKSGEEEFNLGSLNLLTCSSALLGALRQRTIHTMKVAAQSSLH